MLDYGFVHDGTVYTPNQTTGIDPATNDERNRAIEAAELAQWATGPDDAIGYYRFPSHTGGGPWRREFYPLITGADVTSWLGTRIGTITRAHVYTDGLGHRMVSLTITGTNGARYHGRASWDHGTVIRLRKIKGDR